MELILPIRGIGVIYLCKDIPKKLLVIMIILNAYYRAILANNNTSNTPVIPKHSSHLTLHSIRSQSRINIIGCQI
jgi:hypothetical protein